MSQKEKNLLLSDVTIGADIEVFLMDKTSKEIVSAEGIIKGTKEEPFRFKKENQYFATSLDNIMAEFCIPPVKNSKDFTSNIREALSFIESSIPKELEIFAFPSANVNPKYLQTENAKLFGCEPDYNAWKFGSENPKPEPIDGLRSCGGHIHIGYKNPNNMLTVALMKAMDIFVGLPSIIQEPNNKRKELYGKAGAFRFKDYGGEYRTISNYYVNSPELMSLVFNNTLQAVDFINRKMVLTHEEEEAIQAAINFNDSKLASTLCSYFGVMKAS